MVKPLGSRDFYSLVGSLRLVKNMCVPNIISLSCLCLTCALPGIVLCNSLSSPFISCDKILGGADFPESAYLMSLTSHEIVCIIVLNLLSLPICFQRGICPLLFTEVWDCGCFQVSEHLRQNVKCPRERWLATKQRRCEISFDWTWVAAFTQPGENLCAALRTLCWHLCLAVVSLSKQMNLVNV